MCFSLLNKNSLFFDFKFSLKEICVLFDVLNTFILKSESSECQEEVWKKQYIHTFAATELKFRIAWQTGVNGKPTFFSSGAIDWCASNSVMEKSGECETGRFSDEPCKTSVNKSFNYHLCISFWNYISISGLVSNNCEIN